MDAVQTIRLRMLIPALILICGTAPIKAEENGAGISTQPATAHMLNFWPRRIAPDTTHQIYVQLALPERTAEVTLHCPNADVALGSPLWSDPRGLIHTFDLEWTAPRTRQLCSVSVTGRSGRTYESTYKMIIRPRVRAIGIKSVSPESTAENSESTIEIFGRAMTETVNILWVSADEFVTIERSVSPVQLDSDGQLAVVPFAPDVYNAPPGTYLLIVENEDRTAAIWGRPFVVAQHFEPQIESTHIDEVENHHVITVEGYDLDSVETARLFMPAGETPLVVRYNEGRSMTSLSVTLPRHVTSDSEILSALIIKDDQLRIYLGGNRLTRTIPKASPQD
jgi:hypothetical protein